MGNIGKPLIIVGLILVVIGLLLSFAPKMATWIGKLPGDITFKRGNFSFYFPIATSLLFSIILSFILWLFRK